MFAIRLEKVRLLCKELSVDALLISDVATIIYLTGYAGFSEVEREALLLISQNDAFIFTDGRYAEAINQQIPHFCLVETNAQTPLLKNLEQILHDKQFKMIGFEDAHISVEEYHRFITLSVLWRPCSLESIRKIKSGAEIKAIQEACTIADNALAQTRHLIQTGLTEKEIANILESVIRELGAEVSFRSIVAFGENAAIPHHMTSDKVLNKDNLVLIDFGAKHNNYCSDCTRTFFINDPTKEQKKMYQTVQDAQQKAINYLHHALITKNEVKASEVDKVAREYILSQGFPTIPHSLGHGIGIRVHETPTLSPRSEDKLTNGMVFSIEPGIYLAGNAGVRIEDLFAIQDNKLIQLTHAPKDLHIAY